MARHWAAAFVFSLVAGAAFAQGTLLDQIGDAIDRGKLNVEVNLKAGRAPTASGWTVQVKGTPKATLVAEATDGKVRRLDIAIAGGYLMVNGQRLRPDLLIEGIRFEDGKGIVETRFRGRGIWRPIVAMFRPLARSTLRKLELHTDIPSVLRGDLLASSTKTTTTAPAKTGSFLDLVREVHIHDSEFVAFAGRPLTFDTVELKTASHPKSGMPLHAAIDRGVFRPPAQFTATGRLDGEIEDGAVAFVGSRCTFSHGEIRKGTFQVASGANGTIDTSIGAGALDVELTSGQFRWPGGPRIGVEAPSRFAIRDLSVRPDGSYSGIVDATLSGKVGALERGGTVVSASDVKLRTQGTTIVNGRATGDAELEFEYHLNYSLVVHYPLKEIGDRRVPLVFQGSFATKLHFEDAGSGDEGVVTGTYRFTVPWPPVEKAAFEVLRAKWSQDIPPVVRKVGFAIEPRRFGPCGGNCFLVDLGVTAETSKSTGILLRQICEPEGKADLVVDVPSRSLILRNVRVEPRCKGVLGAIVNFIAPFLTKSYSDVVLFQMPADLPFTIESVGNGEDWISIGGAVAWKQ